MITPISNNIFIIDNFFKNISLFITAIKEFNVLAVYAAENESQLISPPAGYVFDQNCVKIVKELITFSKKLVILDDDLLKSLALMSHDVIEIKKEIANKITNNNNLINEAMFQHFVYWLQEKTVTEEFIKAIIYFKMLCDTMLITMKHLVMSTNELFVKQILNKPDLTALNVFIKFIEKSDPSIIKEFPLHDAVKTPGTIWTLPIQKIIITKKFTNTLWVDLIMDFTKNKIYLQFETNSEIQRIYIFKGLLPTVDQLPYIEKSFSFFHTHQDIAKYIQHKNSLGIFY